MKKNSWICILVLVVMAIVALSLTMAAIKKRNQDKLNSSTTTLSKQSAPTTSITDRTDITTEITTEVPSTSLTTAITTSEQQLELSYPHLKYLAFPLPVEIFRIEISEDDPDVIMLAKLLYKEADVVPSLTERAAVLWVVLNRVDRNQSTISGEVTKEFQFAWDMNAPVKEEHIWLAMSVLQIWKYEHQLIENGELEQYEYPWLYGRLLPSNYRYFYGDGKHNYFYSEFTPRVDKELAWDWSWPSPYVN